VGLALANRARWRGAVLLECMLALAIFVAAGLTIMAMMDRAASSVAETRDAEVAVDVARTAMAKIEAGIATPETLNGPVPAWRDERGATFDDSLPEGTGWALEISTAPSQFPELTAVTVRAVKQSKNAEEELASYTLHQLVRLAPKAERRDVARASGGGGA
jgi:hypothetical protein